tara:strand:+ start:318 stop:1079 length:762 start_codon:yes stop_codon:yes gene_type:complete
MDLGIENRVALVTGSSRGIGRSIAATLASEGARVILVARSQDQLELVRAELPGKEGQHHCFAIDLMSDNGVSNLVESIIGKIGYPDIAVNNLGGSYNIHEPFASSKQWQEVWQFNLGIGHELNRAFIPQMVKNQWGRIVHISTLATNTFRGSPAYVSAKCALNGYVKSMSNHYSKDNVIISAVSPGAIYLEGRYFAKTMKENPSELEEYYKNYLPIGRLGKAEEVGASVAFMCSELASFMPGSIVGIDGGGID